MKLANGVSIDAFKLRGMKSVEVLSRGFGGGRVLDGDSVLRRRSMAASVSSTSTASAEHEHCRCATEHENNGRCPTEGTSPVAAFVLPLLSLQ